MDYIQEDFDDMKKLIEDIKGNKILKIDGGQEQEDFIKLYRELIGFQRRAQMGVLRLQTQDLYNDFKNASYITFNSNDLSTPEDRKAMEAALLTGPNEELNIKRQYLLEFISYIYITRKNDMESYLYYIEKIGDLTQYNPKKLHEGVVETTEGEVETTEEVRVTPAQPELPDSESTYSDLTGSESTVSDLTGSELTEAPSPAGAPETTIKGGYGGQYDKRRRTPVKRR